MYHFYCFQQADLKLRITVHVANKSKHAKKKKKKIYMHKKETIVTEIK